MSGAWTGSGGPAFEVYSDGVRSAGRYRRALQNVGQHRCLDKGHHARAGLDYVGHLQRGRESGLRDEGPGTRGTTEEHVAPELSAGRVRYQRHVHSEFTSEHVISRIRKFKCHSIVRICL